MKKWRDWKEWRGRKRRRGQKGKEGKGMEKGKRTGRAWGGGRKVRGKGSDKEGRG